jgi:undecaprenyl-diphosphatase
MLKKSLPRLHRFAAARVSPEGEFGLHLTLGVVLMLAAAWVFAGIAEDVVEGDRITLLDAWLAHWFHDHATHGMTRLMLFISHLQGVAGTIGMTLLLAWWLHRQRERYWLLALAVTVPGGMLLNTALKFVFHRARPHFDQPLLELSTYSFPSGHAVHATLVVGLLACYLLPRAHTWPRQAAIVVAACLLVALVALSRMYLGVHYLSDVLAAIAEGCAWLAVCVTAVSTLRRHRRAQAAGAAP